VHRASKSQLKQGQSQHHTRETASALSRCSQAAEPPAVAEHPLKEREWSGRKKKKRKTKIQQDLEHTKNLDRERKIAGTMFRQHRGNDFHDPIFDKSFQVFRWSDWCEMNVKKK
jgi:hypothetical protein